MYAEGGRGKSSAAPVLYLYGATTAGGSGPNLGLYRFQVDPDTLNVLTDTGELMVDEGTDANHYGSVACDPATGRIFYHSERTDVVYGRKIRAYDGAAFEYAAASSTNVTGQAVLFTVYGGYLWVCENSNQLYRYNLDLTGRTLIATVAKTCVDGWGLSGRTDYPFVGRAYSPDGYWLMDTTGAMVQIAGAVLRASQAIGAPDLLGVWVSNNNSATGRGLTKKLYSDGSEAAFIPGPLNGANTIFMVAKPYLYEGKIFIPWGNSAAGIQRQITTVDANTGANLEEFEIADRTWRQVVVIMQT
jgi:hypothetical protein